MNTPTIYAVLTAIGSGARTGRIARQLGCKTSKARYHLAKMERAGLVHRNGRFTCENDIYWCAGKAPI